MTTINEEWKEFERDVVPADALHVQRQEMRRAFYAGYWAMLCEVSGGDLPLDEELEARQQECQRFRDDVLAGKV